MVLAAEFGRSFRFVRKAPRQEDGDGGTIAARPLGEFKAAFLAGQASIGEQHIDVRPSLKDSLGFKSAACLDHAKAAAAQVFGYGKPKDDIGFDHKNGL
jgi:hypothetical protein